MPATFAWVDFDEASRRQMLDVIETFRDQDTVDELGIGTIRDAFADYFFPGTSTIQTRARYFLFIPWIYAGLEKRQVPSAEIAAAARKAEVKLIDTLVRSDVGENEGVIGMRSRSKLQRLPSNIYWVGLYQWGIRKFIGAQDKYHRSLDAYYRRGKDRLLTDDKEPVDGPSVFNWDPHIPAAPEGFLQNTTLELRRNEAKYLQDRISEIHGQSLLAAMINAQQLYGADLFWENEQLVRDLPEELKEIIGHARDFALTIHGAALLYNLMLAEAKNDDDLTEEYQDGISQWASRMMTRHDELSSWHTAKYRFWKCSALNIASIPSRTSKFVEEWWSLIFAKRGVEKIQDSVIARELIKEREIRLKRGRARLANDRYRELWSGASGTAMLNYRWNRVSVIIADIRQGLDLTSQRA